MGGVSPRNSWKSGGSLQVRTALSPASFSHPGSVTVNRCLLALLAIHMVTECCPQSHRNRARGWGSLFWAVPGVRWGLWGWVTPLPRPQRGICRGLCQAEQPRAFPGQRAPRAATFSRSWCSAKLKLHRGRWQRQNVGRFVPKTAGSLLLLLLFLKQIF